MRKYLPGIGLVGLAGVLTILLMTIGDTHANPIEEQLLYATGSHLVIAYAVVGVGLLALAWSSETPHVSIRTGTLIGTVAIAAVYAARRLHPAVGSNMGSDPGIFYVAVIAVLVFVGFTVRLYRASEVVAFLAVAAVVTVVPPLVQASEHNAKLAAAGGSADGFGGELVIYLYAIAFVGGILYGLPFALTATLREDTSSRKNQSIRNQGVTSAHLTALVSGGIFFVLLGTDLTQVLYILSHLIPGIEMVLVGGGLTLIAAAIYSHTTGKNQAIRDQEVTSAHLTALVSGGIFSVLLGADLIPNLYTLSHLIPGIEMVFVGIGLTLIGAAIYFHTTGKVVEHAQ